MLRGCYKETLRLRRLKYLLIRMRKIYLYLKCAIYIHAGYQADVEGVLMFSHSRDVARQLMKALSPFPHERSVPFVWDRHVVMGLRQNCFSHVAHEM